jgi:hypothetical protein
METDVAMCDSLAFLESKSHQVEGIQDPRQAKVDFCSNPQKTFDIKM